MRTEFDPADHDVRGFYQLLTAIVVPRPIAWVATTSEAGVDNLAPHSFFTVACVDPPVVQFTSVGEKDSLRNAVATGEFTVSLTPEDLFAEINATGTDFPADTSEFDAVGLAREPSLRVRPPRVAASPAVLECVLEQTLTLGNSTVVFGRVVHAVVDADTLDDRGLPAVSALAPLARLGSDEWSTIGEVRETTRIRHADWPGHFGS